MLNVVASGRWLPHESRLELADVLLEAPQSKVTANGVLDWNGPSPRYPMTPETQLSVSSQWIAARDLLGWLRAFHAGMADDAAVTGGVQAAADLSGWPPKVDRGLVQSDGITWTSTQRLVQRAPDAGYRGAHSRPRSARSRADFAELGCKLVKNRGDH